MISSLIIVFVSLAIILFGSFLFTNGIEWIGKKMDFSEGVVGSLFAGVGTALPETIIPLIAIVSGTGTAAQDIGIGAILGAPFMLATLTLPLAGFGVYFFFKRGKRENTLQLSFQDIAIDLRYFLISYGLAIIASLSPMKEIHYLIGIVLLALYAHYLKIILRQPSTDPSPVPEPLYFKKTTENPRVSLIVSQFMLGLALIIGSAHFFVGGIEQIASFFQVSPLIFSLLVTPIATELPEKFNSLIWISKKKDHLAISNITGSMVFQSTFPVSIGLFGTPWILEHYGRMNVILTLLASFYFFSLLFLTKRWRSSHLMLGGLGYAAFAFILIFGKQ